MSFLPDEDVEERCRIGSDAIIHSVVMLNFVVTKYLATAVPWHLKKEKLQAASEIIEAEVILTKLSL